MRCEEDEGKRKEKEERDSANRMQQNAELQLMREEKNEGSRQNVIVIYDLIITHADEM